MNTALVIMAAGIGSRFGDGIKQLEPVGPNDEVLMEYALYDAMQAGFTKVIFIIRKAIEKEFHNRIGSRIEGKVQIEYAYQELLDLPEGYPPNPSRTKPWGTGHAILAARKNIREPFAVINADDYYGPEGFKKIHEFLVTKSNSSNICMAGFILGNTLSDNGAVTRGICEVNNNLEVIKIVETSGITKSGDGPFFESNGKKTMLDDSSYVSMNMWGFHNDFVHDLSEGFKKFLDKHLNDVKAEYLLPTMVDELIQSKKSKVTLLPTSERWYGMTYKADTQVVKNAVEDMIQSKKYPIHLF